MTVVYKGRDEISVQRITPGHESLGHYTFVARSGRGTIQTYLTIDELREHVAECEALLAAT